MAFENKIREAQKGEAAGLQPPTRDELKKLIVSGIEAERASLGKASSQPIPQARPSANKIYSCSEFLAADHGSVTPLIGTENDALLVPGEGIFMPGTGGVGKTLFVNQMAINLACGEYFLKWPVLRPCRVLISQAELPPQFFKKRIKLMLDSYELADPKKASMLMENIFIEEVARPFDIAADNGEELACLAESISDLKIDVLIVDPFLSYYQGNENDNCEVRRALDLMKRQVAEPCRCGLVITDHQPKYSTSNKNPEQAAVMRGASAKRDWAASVIALSRMKTPKGQNGTFIQATIDKMRYGKAPGDPFSLRRDDLTFRHTVFRNNEIELHQVAQVLNDAGGGLSQREFKALVVESFSVGDHEARRLINKAVETGWVGTRQGARRSIVHDLTNKYMKWKCAQ